MRNRFEMMKQENDKKNAAVDALLDMFINDDNAPEDVKIDFKLMKARNELLATASGFIEELTLSRDKYTTEQKTEAYEYLTLVMQGIKQYISESSKQAQAD